MQGDVVYSVVSEFGFDVADAVAGSAVLQGAISKVDRAVDHLKNNLVNAAMSSAVALGFGGGGLVAMLGRSLQLTERLQNSQMRFFGLFTANADKMGDSVSDLGARMSMAQSFASQLAKSALAIGRSSTDMLEVGNALASPMLAMHANPARIASMAQKVLITAPVLGQNPQMMTDNLIRLMNGGAGSHNQLFAALVNSGPAMGKFQGHMGAGQFNVLNQVSRFELLEKALAQFADKPEVAAAGLNTLSGQLNWFKSLLFDVEGVLQPIGDFLSKKLVPILKPINAWIAGHLDQIKDGITQAMDHLSALTPKIIEFAFGLRHLKDSYGWAKGAVHLASILLMVSSLVQLLTGKGLGQFMGGGITKAFGALFGKGFWSGVLKVIDFSYDAMMMFGKALKFVAPLLRTVAGLMGLFAVVFFYAEAMYVGTARYFMENIGGARDKLMALGVSFYDALKPWIEGLRRLTAPFVDAFNALADVLGDPTLMLAVGGVLVDFFKELGMVFLQFGNDMAYFYAQVIGISTVFVHLISVLAQLPDAMMQAITGLGTGAIRGLIKQIGETPDVYNFAFQDTWDRMFNRKNGDGSKKKDPTAQGNTNMYGGIQVNMQFKENQEPDRIAFTLKEQIIKAMRNKTQGRGQTMAVQGANG